MKKRIHCRPSWTLQQRLAHYTRVDRISGCHLWQGAVNDGGYGTLGVGGRSRRAHRLAWSLRHGPIPPRMDICHRCDERRCINPDHLFAESHAANMADRGRKDRARRTLAHADRRRDDVAIVRLYYRGVHMKGELSVEPFNPDAVLRAARGRRTGRQPSRRRYSAMRRSQ